MKTLKLLPGFVAAIGLLLSISACTTTSENANGSGGPAGTNSVAETRGGSEPVQLREGDVVRISFPGAPNLDALRAVQRDGKITLPSPLTGDIVVTGKTPAELEAELTKLYEPHLLVKQVSVSIEVSSFPIYVTGAVVRPGEILSNRPITALEAIMKSGGPVYTRANLRRVRVIRDNNGRMETHTIDLKSVLDGKNTKPFYLKPSDIISVPERFTML